MNTIINQSINQSINSCLVFDIVQFINMLILSNFQAYLTTDLFHEFGFWYETRRQHFDICFRVIVCFLQMKCVNYEKIIEVYFTRKRTKSERDTSFAERKKTRGRFKLQGAVGRFWTKQGATNHFTYLQRDLNRSVANILGVDISCHEQSRFAG